MNAETVFKFCQSDIVCFLFLKTEEALTTLAKEVPWFGEWKTAGGLIDFKGDIGAQLCKLFKLTKTEAAYVVNTIRTLDASRRRNNSV